MKCWKWMVAILLGIAFPARLTGQEETTLVPLQLRIRLWVGPDELLLAGNLVALEHDTVAILHEPNGARVAVPISSLRRVERSQGLHSHAGKGALYGFIVGATTVGGVTLLGCSLFDDSCSGSGGDWTGFLAAAFGLAGGLAGTGIGAVIGAMIRTERWQEIPVQRFCIGAAPPSGIFIGLSYRFPASWP